MTSLLVMAASNHELPVGPQLYLVLYFEIRSCTDMSSCGTIDSRLEWPQGVTL